MKIDKAKISRRSVKGFSLIVSALEILGWVTGDPQNIYSLFEPKKKNKLFYSPEKDVYVLIFDVVETKNSILFKYGAFGECGYDDTLKKYIGVDLLGIYTEIYDKNTRTTKFSIEN